MNSSGIKRGLAVSAVSAMAIAGIPLLASSASAESVNDQVGAANVVLYNSDTTPVSIVPDGTDSTVRLEAGAGANFASVTFQFALPSATPVYVDIATVERNDDGAFSFEWTPPAGIIGQTVTLRASSVPTAGGAAVVDDATGVEISNTVPSVNLATGSSKGVFDTPYTGAPANGDGQLVGLTGTASAAGPVVLAYKDGATLSGITAPGDADTDPSDVNATVATGATTATFKGVIDITGYDFAGADELVAAAGISGASQDFESYTLYNQVITTVTATADRTNVPVGVDANVTVTVTDQNGAPVVGAEVRNGVGTLIGYTDVDGKVPTVTQGAGTQFYYANATDNDPFVAAEGDKRSADVVVTEFSPVITTLAATSRDGAAFDFDENTAVDIVVQAKDQFGNNVDVNDAQDLAYYWVLTPFDGSPATVRFPTTGNDTVTADTAGAFNVPLPTGAGVESGTYELFAGLTDVTGTPADESTPIASRLSVKVGQAALTFDGANPQSAPAGSSSVVSGKLALEDGTALPGRKVQLDYARGSAANGTDPTPDAGFTDGTDTGTAPDASVTVTTGTDGSFTATVVDPAEASPVPQGTEIGGTVTATTVAATGDSDNPNAAAATRVVNFTSAQAPANATVTISPIGDTKPGVSTSGTVTVTTPNSVVGGAPVPLSGQQVTLTLPAASGAFFTDNTPSPAPVIGNDAGELNSLGKSITLTTGPSGVTPQFFVSIERDAGFDDDGLVTTVVTATAGPAAGSPSDVEDVDFDSSEPINGGAVQLVLSPAGEQQGGTTPAETDQPVFFDVFTTDQFGNRVDGENVTLTAVGDDDDSNVTAPSSVQSDFDDDGDFAVSSADADNVTVTATWIVGTTKFVADGGDAGTALDEDATGSETLTDSERVTFADGALVATLSGNPETTAPVGSAVTETFRVVDGNGDSAGSNLAVEFTRVGPNGQTEQVTRFTNANGVARYLFTGTAAGTATITGEVTSGGITASATDTVTFTATPVRSAIVARLSGFSSGAKDVLKVKAPVKAAGAAVTFFKKVGTRNVRIGTRTLNRNGVAVLRVTDKNGNKITRYIARVARTVDTKPDVTNVKRLR